MGKECLRREAKAQAFKKKGGRTSSTRRPPPLPPSRGNESRRDISDHVPINIDLAAVGLLAPGLGEHQLAHPIDPLIARLHRKMMRLPRPAPRARRPKHTPLLRRRRHELEAESAVPCGGVFFLARPHELERFECGVEFAAREGGAGDGVVVDVDAVEGVEGLGVAVHGQLGARQAEVVLVPFVPEYFGFALLHPAGVVERGGGRGGEFVGGVDGGEGLGVEGCGGLGGAGGVRGGALEGFGRLGAGDGGEGVGDGGAGLGARDGVAAEAHVGGDGLGLVACDGAEGDGGDGHIHLGGRAAQTEDLVAVAVVPCVHCGDWSAVWANGRAVWRNGVVGLCCRYGELWELAEIEVRRLRVTGRRQWREHFVGGCGGLVQMLKAEELAHILLRVSGLDHTKDLWVKAKRGQTSRSKKI